MKKNKRLLYTLENIPEKYLDEALEEKAIEEKEEKHKINWKSVVVAAACASVFALPAYIYYVNSTRNSVSVSENGLNMIPGSHPFENIRETIGEKAVTDTTVITEKQEITDESEQILMTGYDIYPPSNPSLYLKAGESQPDTEFYTLGSNDEESCPFKMENGYFTISFLKDKDFESLINEEIRAASDRILSQKDEYEGFGEYEIASDANDFENPSCTGGLTIKPAVQNGYFEVLIGLSSDTEFSPYKNEYLALEVLRYDLINQQKIESVAEYSADGLSMDEILDKCGTLILHDSYSAEIYGSFAENGYNFDSELSGFSYLVKRNEDGTLTAVRTDDLKICNYLTPYRERDFSDSVDDVHFSCDKSEYINMDNTNMTVSIKLGDKTGTYFLCGPSRFYTEAQISEMNVKYREYYEAAFRYLTQAYPEDDCFEMISYSCRPRGTENIFTVSILSALNDGSYPMVYIDMDSAEVLNGKIF